MAMENNKMNLTEKIEKYIMYFSKQSCEERRYKKFRSRIKKLELLSIEQLQCKRIYAQKSYEHKKIMFYFLIVVVFISVIADVWNNAVEFLKELLVTKIMTAVLDFDVQRVIFLLVLILVFFISVGLLGCIVSSARTIASLHEEILVLEYIINKKETLDETKTL